MIELQFEGFDEAIAYLESLIAKLESNDFWASILGEWLEQSRRFAVSISPVVTGSYQAAHRVVVGAMQAELSIDPSARNIETGVPVSRYAGPVEERHRVYLHTFGHTERLVARDAQIILKRLA